jgi:hypothetical protein
MKKFAVTVFFLALVSPIRAQEFFLPLSQDQWNTKQGEFLPYDKGEHFLFFMGMDLVKGWRTSLTLNILNEVKDYTLPYQKFPGIGGNKFSIIDVAAGVGGLLAGEAIKKISKLGQRNEKEERIIFMAKAEEELYSLTKRTFEKAASNGVPLVEKIGGLNNRCLTFKDSLTKIQFTKTEWQGADCFMLTADNIYFKIMPQPKFIVSTNINGAEISMSTNQIWYGKKKNNPKDMDEKIFFQNMERLGSFTALIIYTDNRLNQIISKQKS